MALAKHNQPAGNFLLAGGIVETATVAHALPRGAFLSPVNSLAEFAALAPQWRALEDEAAAPHNVFQSFGWLLNWASVYDASLCAVTGYQDGRLVFAWPMMKCRVGPLTVLRWMSEPLSQYGDILIARGQCPKTWMERATGFVRNMRGIDVVRLRHVRDDAAVAPYLAENFRDARMSEQAPWLDLGRFANEAAYDARYSSSQRKRRKKIRKALEDDFGPVSFEMAIAGPARDAAITAAITEKCQWLDERGRQNRALCNARIVDFLKALSHDAGSTAQLVTSCLTAGGRSISWEIGIRHRSTHFGFITSHVTSLTDYSPARLHMDLSQRQALKDGMTAFDLMIPNDAHKESWSSAKVTTRDYYLPVSALGRLYGAGYLETMRPVLRRAYYGMPPSLLRLLKPITGH